MSGAERVARERQAALGLMRDIGAGKIEVLPRFRVRSDDVPASELAPDRILPSPLSDTLYPAVAEATAHALVAAGLVRCAPAAGAVAQRTRALRHAVALRQESLPRG